MEQGFCIWLTGLPSSGKTTIAQELLKRLNDTRHIEVMDGDEIRRGLSGDLGFSKEDRNEHNRRVIFCSKLLARNGVIVIVALISPYRETRAYAKEEIPNTIEVFVSAPLEVCIERDPKGLYKKALAGEVKQFTGIDDPYEEPLNPDVVVETDKYDVNHCVNAILAKVHTNGLLSDEVYESITKKYL